jgi:drug/metabolite transporter (DMT)-like permease
MIGSDTKISQNLKAIGLTSLGLFLFSVGDMLLKSITNTYPTVQIMYMVGIVSVTVLLAYGLIKNGRSSFWTKHPKIHLFRGICATVIGVLEIAALQSISLDVFYTIVFTAPFWIVILEYLLLKDKIGWHRGAVLLFGFMVLLFMIRPDGALFSFGALLMVAAMIVFAATMMSLRFMGDDDNPIWLPLAGPLYSLFLLSPALFFMWDSFIMPNVFDFFICICTSMVFMSGAYYISLGYHRASTASVVAPYQYTQMIWGIVFGYLIFNDIPKIEVIIGAGLLILSGIYLIQFERKGKDKKI